MTLATLALDPVTDPAVLDLPAISARAHIKVTYSGNAQFAPSRAAAK